MTLPIQPRAMTALYGCRIAVQEHAIPGDFHVVEHDEGVLLVEAGREGLVEGIGVEAVVVPADDLEAGSRQGYREHEGDVVGILGDRLAGVDGELVGEGAEGGEDAGATHHDALAGFAHLLERHLAVDAFIGGRSAHPRWGG